jgi:integrase/recombinase XerD
MAIEYAPASAPAPVPVPVPARQTGGALVARRAADVVPFLSPPPTYAAAVERYLTGAGAAKSSAWVQRISLTTWGWMFRGHQAPVGPGRHGAAAPPFPLGALGAPLLPRALAELAAGRADVLGADTVKRELAIARKAIGWWLAEGWITADPTIGIERRPTCPDLTKALAKRQVEGLWQLNAPIREKTLWTLVYESAAPADEVLSLNVEDLLTGTMRGRLGAWGGPMTWIHWRSGTAQLLPHLITGRTRGPLFLSGREAHAWIPETDRCPFTGRARLSCPRAEEIFEESTRLLVNPLARPKDIDRLKGWRTLERLRHSAFAHAEADGVRPHSSSYGSSYGPWTVYAAQGRRGRSR